MKRNPVPHHGLIVAMVMMTTCSVGCVRAQEADDRQHSLTVATWNLEWFYDHNRNDNISDLAKSQSAPSAEAWKWKLREVARVIAEIRPDIIALQEVENRRVLTALTDQLRDEHQLRYRVAFIEGGDVHTEQDVAVLYRGDLLSISRNQQTAEMFASNRYYNVQKHLIARFRFRFADDAEESLTLVTAHLRAGPDQAAIRRRQGRLLHTWVKDEIVAGKNVIVLGDLNSDVRPGAGSDSELAAILGLESETEEDDLLDLHERSADTQHATHITRRAFDRILVSRSMLEDVEDRRDWTFDKIQIARQLVVRGSGPDTNHFENYWAVDADERDVSDHYPVVARFMVR